MQSPELESSFSATANVSRPKYFAIVVAIIRAGSNCGKPSRRFPNISGTRRQVPEISVTDDGAVAKLKIM
jgi:hypothetical protein